MAKESISVVESEPTGMVPANKFLSDLALIKPIFSNFNFVFHIINMLGLSSSLTRARAIDELEFEVLVHY